MTLIIGTPEGVHELPYHHGLIQLWIRDASDLFDPIVPIARYKATGDEGSYIVQTPPGVELYCHPHIERGTAYLVFEGGAFWPDHGKFVYRGNVKEVKGRKRQPFVSGVGLLTKAGAVS